MDIYTGLIDKKIMGINVSAEMSFKEYLDFAPEVIQSNDLQRTQVRSDGKPYDLLRRDLIVGCVIPPIILAVSNDGSDDIRNLIVDAVRSNNIDHHFDEVKIKIE